MRDTIFKINLGVKEAFDLLKNSDFADLVEAEYKDAENGKQIGIIILEKYYIRVNSRVSLVVIMDNFAGDTVVKAVGTGGGRSVYDDFDWGASDSFEVSLMKLFKDYIMKI